MTYVLRAQTENDLTDLLEIELLTQAAPWTAETFQRCWQVGYLGWVIEQDKKVVGFIVASFQVAECHILNLCVHPDHQRHGYGKALLTYVLEAAKAGGSGIAFLEVRRSNLHAIALYSNAGFVQIAERQNYYPTATGREDALVFAKDLHV